MEHKIWVPGIERRSTNTFRDLIRQSCDSMDVQILKGVVSKDHVHLHLSYTPKLSISEIVKRLKGRRARVLLEEFGELRKRYWGGHFWGIGYWRIRSMLVLLYRCECI